MRDWYVYTGTQLIIGQGRAIRHVVPDSYAAQKLLDTAQVADIPSGVGKDTFAAALAAAMAARELSDEAQNTTAFVSQQQLFQLFDDVNVEQAALNIINARAASTFTQEDLPARTAQGFASGKLWQLPRDASRLRDRETLLNLPGVVATLLMREQAERKAFATYLRRGAPPVVSSATLKELAAARPVLRTWERELRLLKGDTA